MQTGSLMTHPSRLRNVKVCEMDTEEFIDQNLRSRGVEENLTNASATATERDR